MSIASNLAAIRGQIAAAAQRAGRDPSSITLVAVSKFQPVSAMEEAYAAGQRAFGENRVQEAEEKRRLLAARIEGPDPLTLDLIGPLQSNKARKAVTAVSRIQSIDGAEIGERVGRIAAELGQTMPVLIQVDLAGEATKSGVPEAELGEALTRLAKVSGIAIGGLMAIPPYLDSPENVRPYFKRLRELRERYRGDGVLTGSELSMGMSHDFEVAIEEGATIVRVGTAIFGERPRAA